MSRTPKTLSPSLPPTVPTRMQHPRMSYVMSPPRKGSRKRKVSWYEQPSLKKRCMSLHALLCMPTAQRTAELEPDHPLSQSVPRPAGHSPHHGPLPSPLAEDFPGGLPRFLAPLPPPSQSNSTPARSPLPPPYTRTFAKYRIAPRIPAVPLHPSPSTAPRRRRPPSTPISAWGTSLQNQGGTSTSTQARAKRTTNSPSTAHLR